MVQANSKKLENIEKFLERLGGKIEVYLTASEPGSELNKAKKHKENLVCVFNIINYCCFILPLFEVNHVI